MNKNQEELERIKDNLMYDFPKHYNNYHIMAYQNGVKKLASAILSAGFIRLEKVELDEDNLMLLLSEKIPAYSDPLGEGDTLTSLNLRKLAHAIATAQGIMKVKK